MHLGTNIRRYRESRGWSQEALAANLDGISQSTVSRIESNKQDVTLKQLELFSGVFGISIDDLMHPPSHLFYEQTNQLSSSLPSAGPETITANKGDVIAAMNEVIDVLKSRIKDLEHTEGKR